MSGNVSFAMTVYGLSAVRCHKEGAHFCAFINFSALSVVCYRHTRSTQRTRCVGGVARNMMECPRCTAQVFFALCVLLLNF